MTSLCEVTSKQEIGRNILKANAVMLGNLTSAGHPNSWDLRPGMIYRV